MQTEITFGADRAAVERVTGQLTGIGRLGVAFSGGVDSATLLALAVLALGPEHVVALLGGVAQPRRRRASGRPMT